MADRFADTLARAAESAARKEQAADAKRGGTAAHEAMHDTSTARATSQTQKPQDAAGGGGNVVPETSLPNESSANNPLAVVQSERAVDEPSQITAEYDGQISNLAPLPPERDRAIQNSLQELIAFLKAGKFSKKCQENVIDKLNNIKGFSLDKFVKFLELGGDFYDGTKSSAPLSVYAPDGGYTITIAQRFKNEGGLAATTAYGSNVSKFTVFFRPKTIETEEKKSRTTGAKISGLTNDNLVFIFHEGLHGFGNFLGQLKGNYDDDTLKSKNIFDLHPTNSNNTKIISDHIKENCF